MNILRPRVAGNLIIRLEIQKIETPLTPYIYLLYFCINTIVILSDKSIKIFLYISNSFQIHFIQNFLFNVCHRRFRKSCYRLY